jgi:hypothetical protein
VHRQLWLLKALHSVAVEVVEDLSFLWHVVLGLLAALLAAV